MPALSPAAEALAASDEVLGRLIAAVGPCGLVPDRARSPYHHLTRAIAYQQLNGTAAATIFGRFLALFDAGEAFPAPDRVLAMPVARLRGCGLSASKIAAVHDLARHAIAGTVPDTPDLDLLEDAAIIERLTAVRGVGRWTVEMMLMFQLGRPDVLPVDDYGVRNGFKLAYGLRKLPAPRALAAFGARWAPWRSTAAWYLWRAVDLAKDGRLPPPPKPAPRLPRVAVRRRRVSGAAASRARPRRSGARTR